jgi:TPP-dependent pyruvate/acetoin dehydrogenase alpha subunit
MSGPMQKMCSVPQISTRAVAYGIPGETVDGNDILAVYRAVKTGVDWARAGEGPSLIENVTYRWRGHSKSDRNLYRTQEEIDAWKEKCPIKRFRQLLLETETMSAEALEAIDQEAKATIDRAADEAVTFPEPSPENMEDEVYAP